MIIQQIRYPSDFEAKKNMIEIGRQLAEKSFAIAGEGSMSVRVGPNTVWFCADGADKGLLKQDNFVRLDMNGRTMPGSRNARVPEDAAAHLRLYAQNQALRAVIHAYPPGAVAMAFRGESIEPADYTPAVRKLGSLKLVSGRDAAEVASAAELSCKTDCGILIAGDGCMVWAESLTEAFQKLETVEYYAKLRRLLGACETPRAASVPEKQRPVFAGMEGLTGIIRPGDAAPMPAAESVPVRPAAPAPVKAAPRPEEKRPTAPAAKPAPAVRPEEQARSAKRRDMMAEVVRRSLTDM